MHTRHRLTFLLLLGVTTPLAAQQALPLPRVDFEVEARMQDLPGPATIRHRGGVLRFEASADGGRMVMLQNLTTGEMRGLLEGGGQRMALPSTQAPLPWSGQRGRREGEARVAGESCTLWRLEQAEPGILCLTADGVPLRYQESGSGGMGGDVQHSQRRPAGAPPMVTVFEAVRVTRRAQQPALFDMAALPAAPAAPPAAGTPGMAMPGMPPGMAMPGMPPGMAMPVMPPGMAAPTPEAAPPAPVAAAPSNPADFARHPRAATGRGSLPANVTAAEAGEAMAGQIGQMVMFLRLCAWTEIETGFKGAFGLQAQERMGFTAQDSARAYDHAVTFAGEMIAGMTADPRAATMMRLQMCQASMRDSLTQSIANGTVF